ncbi:DUF2637 domain-containing protein [Actinokineospora globicatena]|uniref:DUF2637 domain-containing protein n=1 Tax=Actinokineospora globicatena TaxID=103729 RepID=UPI0020A388DA|nr:DUF2637 domain-containing protein [Actinokineospora globicatena]MCP2306088.1 Protein of unknown function (DUF2637) [Actinokineospora globicatena]GLW80038.1 hypothetical protein Aglo01_45190 [Actinokineospora globicatena]GLW86867.1 hypothetical protein Aglo02_45060 [Actinokineospora globicatena]
MSTQDSDRRRISLVDVTGNVVAVVLGGIGGAAGFKHTHDWAIDNGQTGWLAWAVAVVVEGLAVVAGFEVMRDHQRGHHKRVTLPTVVLVVAFGVQMAAQVSGARDTLAGWLLAAMPALGFLVVCKLLMRRTATTVTPPPQAPRPTVVAASRPDHPTQDPVAAITTGPDTTPEIPPATPRAPRLPPPILAAIRTEITTARRSGRAPTVEDVTRVVALPPDTAALVLADLDTH